MEIIKLGFRLIVEFLLLEKKLVATILGVLAGAWLIGLLGGCGGFDDTAGVAFFIALLGGLAASFVVPKFVQSSFKEVNYSMDWIFHALTIVVAIIYTFFVIWPILACFA